MTWRFRPVSASPWTMTNSEKGPAGGTLKVIEMVPGQRTYYEIITEEIVATLTDSPPTVGKRKRISPGRVLVHESPNRWELWYV